VRADRLVSLALLLQTRGRMSARAVAAELEVSVRTVYRDLAALSAAGVPVIAEPGPGGGCELLEGYRFPLRGLSPGEAEALLVLGVPTALAELGLADALAAAHRKISVTAGLGGRPARPGDGPTGGAESAGPALVHLDMPRWFHGKEDVPHLRTLAEALRQHRQVRLGYRLGRGGAESTRVVDPFGLVNKAGVWYLVASAAERGGAAGSGAGSGSAGSGAGGSGAGGGSAEDSAAVYRAGRITAARVLPQPSARPAGFDLAAFWDRWSASFVTSRPKVEVRVRAAPAALALFGEVFGDAVHAALGAAPPPDDQGYREVTLSFEHEAAAAHRLAGFGGTLEVLSPATVRARLVDTARHILERYPAG
jgi:predicted DNA-binding transcriptional regulator YafY